MVKKQSGFSTIEILIATSILVVVFSAVILLVLGSQKLTTDTQTAHEAQLLNEKILESARSTTITDFNNNLSNIIGTNPEGIYTKSLTSSYISPCVRKITSRIDWTREGRPQYVTATTQVTNPAFVFSSGTECNTTPPSGGSPWEGCYQYSSADLPSSNYDAYDVAVARINGTKYLFMVGHPSNQNNPEDLWIYNINNVASPTYVNKIDANADNQHGLNAIVVVKQGANYYAYMAGDDNKKQLAVVNVTDPTNLGTPTTLTINGFGNGSTTKAIEYVNNTVFLAINNTIQAINVTTPATPTVSSVISLSNGVNVNKLALNNSYLFAATSDNNAELVRILLSNYATRTSYNAPGNEDGTAVYVTGGTAYLGRTQNNQDLDVVDVSSGSLTSLGLKNMNHQNNSDVVDIVVTANFAFVASTSANKELQVYNVSNPSNIIQKCLNPAANPTNIGFGMTVFENYVYMAMRSNSELAVFADHQ